MPRLVVAMDPGHVAQEKSLHMLILSVKDGRLAVDADQCIHDESLEAGEMETSEQQIRNLLYTVESLRKKSGGAEEDAETGGAEVTAEAAKDETLATEI